MQIYPSLQNEKKKRKNKVLMCVLCCLCVSKSCTSGDHFSSSSSLKISLHFVTNCCGISMSTAKRGEEPETTENKPTSYARSACHVPVETSQTAVAQTAINVQSTFTHPTTSARLFDSVLTSTSWSSSCSTCPASIFLFGEPEVLILSFARAVERSVGVRGYRRSNLRVRLEHGGGRLQVSRKWMTMMRVTSVVCSTQDGASSRAAVMCRRRNRTGFWFNLKQKLIQPSLCKITGKSAVQCWDVHLRYKSGWW